MFQQFKKKNQGWPTNKNFLSLLKVFYIKIAYIIHLKIKTKVNSLCEKIIN